MSFPKPLVTIIGRSNTGKSTLFNRLIEEKKALVSHLAGTTRDINTGRCFWRGQNFFIADTGGLEILRTKLKKTKDIKSTDELDLQIEKQIRKVLLATDIIIFLTDTKEGFLAKDRAIAFALHKLGKPIIFAANKTDGPKEREKIYNPEWQRAGLGIPLPVSAANGSGTGDLLDKVTEMLGVLSIAPEGVEIEKPPIKLAIIGKPNVGKSSLLNSLLGEERAITSDKPYTTRESIDTFFVRENEPYILVDTAGIRKKAKIAGGIEKFSSEKALEAMERADIALLVTEVNQPLAHGDIHLAGLVRNSGRGIVIIANKWDLVEMKDTKLQKKFSDYYYRYFPQLSYAPVIFLSAKHGKGVSKIFNLVKTIAAEREKLADPELLKKIIREFPRVLKLRTITQISTKPPEFLIMSDAKPPLPHYTAPAIEKKIRQYFGYTGTPIRIIIESSK